MRSGLKWKISVLACLAALPACKKDASKLASDDSAQSDIDIELDNQDIDLPGPVENLLSLVYGTPVFGDGKSIRTELRFDPKKGLDPVAAAIQNLPKSVGDAVTIEDGGIDSLAQTATETVATTLKFRGVCVDGVAYLLVGTEELNNYTFEPLSGVAGVLLKNVAKMPKTYRTDLVSCKDRVNELIKIKYKEPQNVDTRLTIIESLNFAFSFIPGYSGAENISNGKAILGTAEIVADIASLGAATKFKAGWQTLTLSKRMYRSVQGGFRMATIGSNMNIVKF